MIKRPLHPQFSQAVLDRVKDTTIRDKGWPIETPIMLYNWSGSAYRSPQIDIAVVIVTRVLPIQIYRRDDEVMFYSSNIGGARMLYEREGFQYQAGMDAWFRPVSYKSDGNGKYAYEPAEEEDKPSRQPKLEMNQPYREAPKPKAEKPLSLPAPKRGSIRCICDHSDVAPRQTCTHCGRPFSESHNRTHGSASILSHPTLRLLP